MFKKTIISCAVAATLIPVSAPVIADDPTLYGRVRLGVLVSDVDNEDTTTDLANVSSRFGIKGSEDLGNGLKAVYRYEFAVNADQGNLSSAATRERQRKSYVALEGGFGRITLGTEDSAVDVASGYIDPTEDLGDNINPFTGRADNLVQYSFATDSVEAIFGVKVDGDDRASDSGVDEYYASLQYFTGGLIAGVFYEHNGDRDAVIEEGEVVEEAEDEIDRIGAGLIYEAGQFRVGVLYAQEDNGSPDDYTGYGVSLEYSPTDKTSYGIVYQVAEDDDDPGADADYSILTAKYFLSARTSLFGEYLHTNFDSDEENDSDDLLIGLRHDF